MPGKPEETVTLPISILQDYLHSINLMNELLSHFDLSGEDEERYKYVGKLVTQSQHELMTLLKV